MDNKSKNIFDNLLNSVSNRDEKAALEAAKKLIADLEKKVAEEQKKAADNGNRAIAAEKKVAELQAALNKTQTAGQASMTAAEAGLKAQLAKAQTDLTVAQAKLKAYENAQMAVQQQAASAAAAQAQILATHKLTKEETLSHLSLNYYGHATEPYWRIIYEANKEVIGDNPNHVRSGMVLNIPVLPDSMKK